MITELVLDKDSEMNQQRELWATHIKNVKRVNLLFGGNGCGKTSLLDDLSGQSVGGETHSYKGHLKPGDPTLNVVRFKCSEHNQRNNYQPQNAFEFVRHMEAKSLSEGQGVIRAVSDFLYFLKTGLEKDKHYLVLIDEIDSGLDSYNVMKVTDILRNIIDNNSNLQVFISFNNFEMTKLVDEWLNMYTGKYEKVPETYDEYFDCLKYHKEKYVREIDKKIFE